MHEFKLIELSNFEWLEIFPELINPCLMYRNQQPPEWFRDKLFDLTIFHKARGIAFKFIFCLEISLIKHIIFSGSPGN
jgi:hypothetical protein